MSRLAPQTSGSIKPSVVPRLQPGDRLTRAEFERRFDATPGLKKAELIEGIVYMPPPVSFAGHSEPHQNLMYWLGTYKSLTPGIRGGDNGSLRLDLDNMPQPDGFLMIPQHAGGQAIVDEDDYVAGAPELVAEIAASSVSYDLHQKLNVYRRNGVREYVVWRTHDRAIDYLVLREGQYDRLAAGADGIIRSEIFPGLWLAPEALLGGDLAAVAKTVQQGAGTAEHAEFLARVSRS